MTHERGSLIQVVNWAWRARFRVRFFADAPSASQDTIGLTALNRLLVNFDPFLTGAVIFDQRQLLLGERGMPGGEKITGPSMPGTPDSFSYASRKTV